MLKYEPETYITQKHMKIEKEDLEKKLIEVRGNIAIYEAKREELKNDLHQAKGKKLTLLSNRIEEEIETINKKLQEFWAEFREIYCRLGSKH